MLQVFVEPAFYLTRNLPRVEPALPRRLLELVLAARVSEVVLGEVPDVGDVHHLMDSVAAVLERAPQEVRHRVGPVVPDVRPAVDGGAAVVHPHLARMDWAELFGPPRKAVEEPQGSLSQDR